MNQMVVAAAQRQMSELERLIAQHWAQVERLVAANRDATQATRTVRSLEQTLLLTKEHVRFLLRHEEPPERGPCEDHQRG
ncbi:hypothetical protein [Dongia deserti]|uniref:hypothetical protein n=1 Tax=Dongia deserti TaxID=2268030 RepID=UPI000E658B07|nr:hypothetical protein [Dongia deserti]